MYSTASAFPFAAPAVQSPPSTYLGLNVQQLAAIACMQGLLANPHYGPFSMQELAYKAKEAADALIVIVP